MNTEIFNTRAWNFLLGNRDVESIIRENSSSSLVVRGGVATVLPTINCLRDLMFDRRQPFNKINILTPVNTLTIPSINPQEEMDESSFFSSMTEKFYGIGIIDKDRVLRDSLLILTDDPAHDINIREFIDRNLKTNLKNHLILIYPPREGKNPSDYSLELIKKVRFSTYFGGNNVLFSELAEEILWDYNPKNIAIIGKDPARCFYSSIGAVDYYIVRDSAVRDPESLELWDLHQLAKNVGLLCSPPTNGKTGGNGGSNGSYANGGNGGSNGSYANGGNGGSNGSYANGGNFLDLLQSHLIGDLKVLSTTPDSRFSGVPDNLIAIDLI